MSGVSAPEPRYDAKYASEAFEFLRLFQRIGRSFTGLVLLEIGWTLFSVLAAQIPGDSAALHLPWYADGRFTIRPTSITTTWLVGTVAVAVGWLFFSQTYIWILGTLARVAEPFVVALAFLLGAASLALQGVFLPVLFLVAIAVQQVRASRHRHAWIDARSKQKPGASRDELRRLYDVWMSERAEDDKPSRRELLSRGWRFRVSLIAIAGRDASQALMARVLSPCRIGLAPLTAYSYAEDVFAAKMPLQTFAAAIARLNRQLRDLRALAYVRVRVLPQTIPVTDGSRAAIVRALLRLDVLLWGSYIDVRTGQLWLNITGAPRPAPETPRDDRHRFQDDLFPHQVIVNLPAVTFAHEDYWAAYATMLAAVLQLLQRRRTARTRLLLLAAGGAVALIPTLALAYAGHAPWAAGALLATVLGGMLATGLAPSSLDNFVAAGREDASEVLDTLVTDVFMALPVRPVSKDVIPSAYEQITDIVSQWIGRQLNYARNPLDRAVWDRGGRVTVATRLLETAQRCTRLVPSEPMHFLRAGALACLAGNGELAFSLFDQALRLDTISRIDPIGARVAADMALDELSTVGDAEFPLARFAAHAACVISTGEEYSMKGLREALNSHQWLRLHMEVQKSVPVAIQVVERLLASRSGSAAVLLHT